MVGGNFEIYSVQITGKCICETFPPPLHDLIIRPHVKQPLLSFILISFLISKSFIPNFCGTNYGLSSKTTYKPELQNHTVKSF